MRKGSEGCLDCRGVGYHLSAIQGDPPYECETCFDQEPDWVDVTKRLPPEDGMLVVVFDPSNEPTVWPAKWDKDNKSFSSNGGWFEANEVTHWMPLPPPPKSKEWVEGYKAAEHDDVHGTATDCPYQPTSPWTYPDGHAGPPTKQAVEWETGYDYRMFEHHRGVIRLKVTINTGGQTIETYL